MIRPKIKLQVLPNTSVDVKNPITLDNTTLYNANLINARGNLNGNAATATVLQIARTINGVSFDGSANIIINAVDSTSRIAVSEKGVANGVATLGDNGLISATQLPSYIDDVLEFNNLSMFPVVGEIGKIYVALDTNKTYRWSGSVYIFITSGAVDSVAGKTGIVALNKNDVGLGSVDNTSDLAKPISIVTQTALNNKANILSPVFLGNVTGLGVSTGTSFNGITGLSDTAGLAAGIASAGTSTLVARADHTHPAQTSITGNAATVTTNANLTGVITSLGNATSVASQTGTGSTFVMNTSPTLVTPNIGVATATSLNVVGNTGFISSPYAIVAPKTLVGVGTGILTSIGTVATGTQPRYVAVDPTGRFVYVVNLSSNTVQAYTINQSTGALTSIGTVATGTAPYGVAVDPTGRFVYVVNLSSNTVQAYTINQSTGALTSIGTVAAGAAPYGVAVDPTGRFVYVTNFNSNNVQAYSINQSTGALTSIGTVATGTAPYGVVVDPTGRFVYVTNLGLHTVQAYTINQSTGALTSIGTVATGTAPRGVAVDPTGRFVYVTNFNSNNVQAYSINQSTGVLTSIGTVATGTDPRGVTVDPTGRFVYVVNQSSNNVQAYSINQSTGVLTSLGTVATEAASYGVAVDPTGRFVYVTNWTANTVQAYSINNFSAGVGVFTNIGIGVPPSTFQLQLGTDSAAKPTSNTWTIVSDERLKTNIQSFVDGLDILSQINSVSYELNNLGGMPEGSKGIGVIAQQVKDVIPYAISTFKAKLHPEDEEDTELYSFNSSALQFVVINAIKELNTKINDLENLVKTKLGL